MKFRNTLQFILLGLAALAISACAQEGSGDQGTAPASDTAVRDAEVASGELADIQVRGEAVYTTNCAACHQPTGLGLPGAFPPLAQSDFLQGNRQEVLRSALFGLSGPITVNGVEYNGVMPSAGYLTDEELADAVTYVFTSWGNTGSAVSVEEVAAIRAN